MKGDHRRGTAIGHTLVGCVVIVTFETIRRLV
jgi:hypothetical protein